MTHKSFTDEDNKTHKPRILCVDDEPHNLILMEALLSPDGYEVVSAVNGEEALEIIRTEQIDICLLDVMMPGLDGFEVCRLIKSDEERANIPVIMITAHGDMEKRIQGTEAGAEDFISKPFDSTEVLARVKMLLHAKSQNERRSKTFSEGLVVSARKASDADIRNFARRVIEMEDELRKKVVSELQDKIASNLTAIGINLALMSGETEHHDPKQLHKNVQHTCQSLTEISRSLRDIVNGLRPSALDDFGLLPALRWYADDFSKQTGIAVFFEADEHFPRLKEEKETALFRIAQEALMNAAKHADTPIVTIKLHNDGTVIELAVVDEGKGRTAASSSPVQEGSGWGMKIMRARAELIGGQFFVVSVPENGTVVSVLLPILE